MSGALLQAGDIDTNREDPRARAAGAARLTKLSWIGLLLIVLLFVWSCDGVRVVWEGVITALAPVPTCATEMHIVDGVRCVAEGKSLYPPIDGLPLVLSSLSAADVSAGGLDWPHVWLGSRRPAGRGTMISLVKHVGILALAAWYVRRQRQRMGRGAAPAMLLYFHSSTLTDFFRNRPETPAILLSLAGWMIVQFRPRGWVVLSALAFVGAMSFKPTFVAAPLAACLQLALERQWRAAFQLVGSALLLGAAVVVGSYTLLGRGYFQHTVLAMAANPFEPVERSVMFYSALAQMHWGALLPAAPVSVAWLVYRKAATPLLIYLAVCFGVTTLAHGKVGSDLNYHGELSVLMVLVTATAMGWMFQSRSRIAAVPLVCLIVGTFAAMSNHGPAGTD